MFDPVGAECKACPTGYSVRPDGLECEATRTSGAIQIFGSGTTPYRTTLSCAPNAVSWDGTTCVTCDMNDSNARAAGARQLVRRTRNFTHYRP